MFLHDGELDLIITIRQKELKCFEEYSCFKEFYDRIWPFAKKYNGTSAISGDKIEIYQYRQGQLSVDLYDFILGFLEGYRAGKIN